jgi:selenocysteine-specific elongation factor
MLVGTAGHVNHGKTSLIRALTGIDTDRLPEEKRRGLSVDLGFAYVERPNGKIMGFVDVPGHDHYLHNMIAGILPLENVLLVVAADEGPREQTREHLEILDLIGIKSLIVAITKIDRADETTIMASETRLRADLSRTSFVGARMFRVSTESGLGLDALQLHLDALAAKSAGVPADAGFRLAIDRAFTIPGMGLIVTGTVLSGTVRAGDKVILTPSGLAARIRSLHTQNRPALSASAGLRCAAAISGPGIEKDRINRGDILAAPGLHVPAERIGACLKIADGATLRNSKMLHLYHGTGRTVARLRVLGTEGQSGGLPAELAPAHPITVLYGDRIVLRDEAARRTIAGGIVIDPFLSGHGTSRGLALSYVTAASRRDHGEALDRIMGAAGFVDFDKFCLARNLGPDDAQSLAARYGAQLIKSGDTRVILSGQFRDLAKSRLLGRLAEYHEKHPHILGPRKEEALSYMGKHMAKAAAQACLAEALSEGLVAADGACIRLSAHRPHLAAGDDELWIKIRLLLQSAQLRPPHIGALAEQLAVPRGDMERCLIRLEQFGLLTRLAKNRFFLPDTIDRFGDIAKDLAQDSDDRCFTAASFSQKTGVGRNLSIQILEYMDGIGITKRLGERRRLEWK